MYRNLASALILTERPDADLDANAPKVPGRIITTLAKAKEIRPLVERCVTMAKKGLAAQVAAEEYGTSAERDSGQWKQWRDSENYAKWVALNAPAVTARRRLFKLLRSKEAVSILMEEVAARFEDRPGGYTRIMRLATPRLGDAGTRAILEFVGKHDRVVKRSERPEFGGEDTADDKRAERQEVAPAEDTQPKEAGPSGQIGDDAASTQSQDAVAESDDTSGSTSATEEKKE